VDEVTAVDLLAEPALSRRVVAKPRLGRRARWRLLAFAGLGAALVVEAALASPYIERATSAIDRADLRWLALAVLTELISMGAFARLQGRMLSAAGKRIPARRMASLTYAANAVGASLPGGTVLSAGYVFKHLRSWGTTGSAAGFAIVASGVLSTVSFAMLAVVGAAFAGDGGLSSVLVVAGFIVLATAALMTRRHHRLDLLFRVGSRGLVRMNRIMHRSANAGVPRLERIFLDLTSIKPRNRDWLAGLSLASLNWVADLACLIACSRAIGASGSTSMLLLGAYLAGMSVSSISPLPGGLGVVDAAMVLALTDGGVSAVSATGAVLLYRLFSLVMVVALGWLAWSATWFADRRHERSEQSTAQLTPPAPTAVEPSHDTTAEVIGTAIIKTA
jgi:uncharacterized protein (TIRG00374 family)